MSRFNGFPAGRPRRRVSWPACRSRTRARTRRRRRSMSRTRGVRSHVRLLPHLAFAQAWARPAVHPTSNRCHPCVSSSRGRPGRLSVHGSVADHAAVRCSATARSSRRSSPPRQPITRRRGGSRRGCRGNVDLRQAAEARDARQPQAAHAKLIRRGAAALDRRCDRRRRRQRDDRSRREESLQVRVGAGGPAARPLRSSSSSICAAAAIRSAMPGPSAGRTRSIKAP